MNERQEEILDLLHENQHGIAKAIMVEFRHGSKISCVLTALKNI